MTNIITRKQYMAHEATHEEYYAQFVSPDTVKAVLNMFTVDQLIEAYDKDPNLNSIPLNSWDQLVVTDDSYRKLRRGVYDNFRARIPFRRDLIEPSGEQITIAVLCCIAKSAAREIILENKKARGV